MDVKPRSFFCRRLCGKWFFGLSLGAFLLVASGDEVKSPDLPRSVEDARGRARWMHEIIHGALQVMHRDFFDEDAVERSLPSQSLDDVFAEMARSHSVGIRWLGGNATKGKDHLPRDRFEEEAVAALIAGAPEHESLERGVYRFVGAIKMQNQCLKCHVRDRQTLEDRVGGLAISIPLAAGVAE